jgi:hypothetical protein
MSISDADEWTERHKDFKAGLDADQVELRALLEGLASMDVGIEDERMAGVVDDTLIDRGNSWQERQEVLEDLSGSTANEISRRAEMMQEAYPFLLNGNSVTYRPSATGVYEFCLAAARNPKGTAEGKPHASTIFEWIARDVLALHFGAGDRKFRTGWPPYENENRGVRTKETFELLSAECGGELSWNPAPGYPDDPSHVHLKDCGLDVVVWKPWPKGDKRLANFFALGQCACGKNDITPSKGRELSIRRLQNWLNPVTYAAPLRCFLAALHIPNDKQLRELSQEAGLVFDRARLAMLAESSPDALIPCAGIDYHELATFYATQKAA